MKGPASASVAADLDQASLTSGSDAESGRVWRRMPGALERRAPTFVLVASPEGGTPVKIEGGAIAVWDALAVPGPLGAVVQAVSVATGADSPSIAGDIEAALVALDHAGIVVGT